MFSYENLDNAAASFNKLVAKIAALLNDNTGDVDKAEFEKLKKEFTDAMDNDLNTSMAITAVYNVLKSGANAKTKLALIEDFDKVLSLDLIAKAKQIKENSAEEEIPAEIMELVEQRKEARKAKDFATADAIRDKIAEMGYIVEETRQGTKISKK